MRSNGQAFKSQRLRSPNQRMLKLAQLPLRSLLPSSLYLDHSHCLVLAPATLAALPSTRALPQTRVFHVAHPIDSFAPALSPSRVCPSMSRLPSTLHSLHSGDVMANEQSRKGDFRDRRQSRAGSDE